MFRIRAERDFFAGLLYAVLAIAFLWWGRDYRFGTASRMGPGYFPVALGSLLLAFGATSMVRAFFRDGPPVGGIALRKLCLIIMAVVAFGMLVTAAGLIFALPVMVIVSAFASQESRFDRRALLVLLGLTVFCILVFVKGLGVPMPIFGSWFDGLVPASWQR